MAEAIVFDSVALHYLLRGGDKALSWLLALEDPDDHTGTRRIEFEGVLFYFSDQVTESSRLLVIGLDRGELFPDIPQSGRGEAVNRALRAGLSCFEPSVAIPTSWKTYHDGSRVSFASNPYSTQINKRILMERNPRGTEHAYVYEIDKKKKDIHDCEPLWDAFDDALAAFALVIEIARGDRETDETAQDYRFILNLEDDLSERLSAGVCLTEWYESRLTRAQRQFVDHALDRSVRLQGPAGSGKTVALVVKCLRAYYDSVTANRPIRIAFLTHSMATVDVVDAMLVAMDEKGLLCAPSKSQFLRIATLQEFANEAMQYDLHDLDPLSNDALEGRQLQLEYLKDVLREFVHSDWPAYGEGCSDNFRRHIISDLQSDECLFFCWELMNEFACVLDAGGLKNVSKQREEYLTNKRQAWMMKLESREEKEVALELYARFRAKLKADKVIGIDQMIADYLGYLDSFRWDTIREDEGFDVVFVDELHLFNRQERMVFQFLMRDSKLTPVVLMAYDAKQSPRDTFTQITGARGNRVTRWRDAGLGEIDKIELQDVFRYTPEIAKVLAFVDQTFPAIDFDEEWPAYVGVSQIESGDLPVCTEFKGVQEQYRVVFERARLLARRCGAGKKVAVLCLSADRFNVYVNAGQMKANRLAITSREELSTIRYAGKRFVFSMPEYVAGLQFETVLLIDVNQSEGGDAEIGPGAKRRFISQLYLGASRAENRLEIFATKDRGGLSDALRFARQQGAIKVFSPEEIRNR